MTDNAKRQIPFFVYPDIFESQREEYLKVFQDVSSRGAFILQSDLEEFEASMRSFIGAKYCWGVADGTNALMIGLRAMGIGPGDEVILPSHTYVASAASVHYVGATPVLAECQSDSMMDPESIPQLITEKTRAIMPVQLNGRVCEMDPIMKIAQDNNLKVIEDSAQALGARYKGKSAGTFGSVGTISFYPAKLLGCFGDGGLVISNDPDIGKQLFLLRDHGRDEQGDVVAWGTNSRLDNLQAAFLSVAFARFSEVIERRRRIAEMYQEGLGAIGDLILPPPPESDGDHFDVYQNYELQSGSREALREHLSEAGVRSIIQWGGKAVHQMEALGLSHFSLPATESFFERCFLLPMNMSLTDEEVQYIITQVQSFYA